MINVHFLRSWQIEEFVVLTLLVLWERKRYITCILASWRLHQALEFVQRLKRFREGRSALLHLNWLEVTQFQRLIMEQE